MLLMLCESHYDTLVKLLNNYNYNFNVNVNVNKLIINLIYFQDIKDPKKGVNTLHIYCIILLEFYCRVNGK